MGACPFATPVHIFVMGTGDGRKTADGKLNHGGYWRDEHEWPLALRRTDRASILHPRANSRGNRRKPAAASSTSFQFDPADPCRRSAAISPPAAAFCCREPGTSAADRTSGRTQPIPLSARNDILVFQTEPLQRPGSHRAPFGEALDFLIGPRYGFHREADRRLPGKRRLSGWVDLNIGDGIRRARFRDSLKSETLMRPGAIYPLTIQLYPTSNVFKRGHRIRLDISSSNFPRFDINPNTGEPLNDNRPDEGRCQHGLSRCVAPFTAHSSSGHQSHPLKGRTTHWTDDEYESEKALIFIAHA